MDDRYRVEMVAESDGCYYGIDHGPGSPEFLNNDGIQGFRHFLEKVVEGRTNRGVLPRWWNDVKRDSCGRFEPPFLLSSLPCSSPIPQNILLISTRHLRHIPPHPLPHHTDNPHLHRILLRCPLSHVPTTPHFRRFTLRNGFGNDGFGEGVGVYGWEGTIWWVAFTV